MTPHPRGEDLIVITATLDLVSVSAGLSFRWARHSPTIAKDSERIAIRSDDSRSTLDELAPVSTSVNTLVVTPTRLVSPISVRWKSIRRVSVAIVERITCSSYSATRPFTARPGFGCQVTSQQVRLCWQANDRTPCTWSQTPVQLAVSVHAQVKLRGSHEKGCTANLCCRRALSSANSSTPAISTATAQSLTIDRDGIQINRRSRRVDRREATRIAQRNGINRVRAADMRGRYWVVTGDTRRRRDILRLTIDAEPARVVGRRYIHR